MRSLHTAAALLALGLAGTASAQDLNATNNTPLVGTQYNVKVGTYIDPGASGSGAHWDFSAATGADALYGYVDPATSQYASMFPSATYAEVTPTGDTLFFQGSAAGLQQVGEDATYATYSIQCALSDGQLDLKFPATLGTTWTDPFMADGTYNIGGTPATRSGQIVGDVDGQGMLHLPSGMIDGVLRVHTRLVQQDLVSIVQVNRIRHEWAYYAEFTKMPLMRIVADSISAPVLGVTQNNTYAIWSDVTNVGVQENSSAGNEVKAYPVPTADLLTFVAGGLAGAQDLVITDALGRAVRSEKLQAASTFTLGVADLAPGAYVATFTDRDGRRRSVRFNKQ